MNISKNTRFSYLLATFGLLHVAKHAACHAGKVPWYEHHLLISALRMLQSKFLLGPSIYHRESISTLILKPDFVGLFFSLFTTWISKDGRTPSSAWRYATLWYRHRRPRTQHHHHHYHHRHDQPSRALNYHRQLSPPPRHIPSPLQM